MNDIETRMMNKIDIPLFQPNNHSIWKIEYEPVPESLSGQLNEVMQCHYPQLFEDILSVEQSAGANVNNTSFRVSAHTRDGEKKFLLRRIGNIDFESLKIKNNINKMLYWYGIKVPNIECSLNNEDIVVDKGNYYILYDFFTADHYRGNYDELINTAHEIGKFDHALALITEQFPRGSSLCFTEKQKDARAFSQQIWEDIFSRIEQFTKQGGDISFPKRILECREFIMQTLFTLEQEVKKNNSFSITHIDLHPHNILTDGNRLVAILDLDSLRYTEKMRGVAFALHRLVRQYIVLNKPEEVTSAVSLAQDKFLSAYQEHNHLSQDDIECIPYFIRHEAFSRLTDSMKGYAMTGKILWKNDLEKQLANIAEAQFFKLS